MQVTTPHFPEAQSACLHAGCHPGRCVYATPHVLEVAPADEALDRALPCPNHPAPELPPADNQPADLAAAAAAWGGRGKCPGCGTSTPGGLLCAACRWKMVVFRPEPACLHAGCLPGRCVYGRPM